MIFSLCIARIWFLICQLHPAECSINTLSPVICRDFDPRWGAPDGSQDIAAGWTMKNACRIEKCELCVKQTKAPGNMECVSTKACCKLLLAAKGKQILAPGEQ